MSLMPAGQSGPACCHTYRQATRQIPVDQGSHAASRSRMLLRYAGLNIQMRQSGQYRGQYKISKKGRPLLRKILGQVIFPLVRRSGLYGDYYRRKRLAMPGQP